MIRRKRRLRISPCLMTLGRSIQLYSQASGRKQSKLLTFFADQDFFPPNIQNNLYKMSLDSWMTRFPPATNSSLNDSPSLSDVFKRLQSARPACADLQQSGRSAHLRGCNKQMFVVVNDWNHCWSIFCRLTNNLQSFQLFVWWVSHFSFFFEWMNEKQLILIIPICCGLFNLICWKLKPPKCFIQ